MTKISENLDRLFMHHRIILWYDEGGEYAEDVDSLELKSVSVLRLENNAFALKHRMLVQEPGGKFLVYANSRQPEYEDNWLLDIELANYVFRTDPETLVLQELELPRELRAWAEAHQAYFKNRERLKRFREAINKGDDEKLLTARLWQSVLKAGNHTLDELLQAWASAYVQEKTAQIEKEMKLFQLNEKFWEEVSRVYGYRSENPGIFDFLVEMFRYNFGPLSNQSKLNDTARVLFSKWKDSSSFASDFRSLSENIDRALHMDEQLDKLSLEALIREDAFERIDQCVIRYLAEGIAKSTYPLEKVNALIKERELKFWYSTYKPYYKALQSASLLKEMVAAEKLQQIASLGDGAERYAAHWYKADQYYRHFLQYYREAHQNTALNALYQLVHRIYSNDWLIQLSTRWQEVVDRQKGWYDGPRNQRAFFSRDIQPYLDKKTKVFVVISDAFRYECGQELHKAFLDENRFSSRLEFQISSLPSYTQLGMASLLPHKELSFGDGEDILADGSSTKGLEPRKKILASLPKIKATAIRAEDLIALPSRGEVAQDLIQNHDLVYVYHNRVDKVGDDKTQETKVVEAAREEVDFLIELAKKIANMNGNHIVFTADHGFIYQNEPIAESDFTDAGVEGEVIRTNRRFVLGTKLLARPGVNMYQATALGIASDVQVLIPKGIARLRVQGAGSRYVHGGSSLQECVVPVLFVTKKRTDTLQPVGIDILNKMANRITTHIFSVSFYQQAPISKGLSARTIKAYFEMDEGGQRRIISDVFQYTFNSTSDSPENREVRTQFRISSGIKQQKEVFLVVEEQVEDTSQWSLMFKQHYVLSITMENDFDMF